MVTVLNTDEFVSLFAFTALWIQPVIWAMLKKVKSRGLDLALISGLILAVGSYFPLYYLGFIEQYPPLRIYYFYGCLGAIMAMRLNQRYGWSFTQAISVSALALFVSSTLWEIPLLLLNAIRTGPEPDWILHMMVLFYILWIREWPGWDPFPRVGILFAIFLTMVVITVFPITPPGLASEWNSLPYLVTRGYSAYIVYNMINKEPKT